jgi:hypothetical protein
MSASTKSKRGKQGKTGTAQPSRGLVIRSIKGGTEEQEQLIALLQKIGEMRFSVKRIEELKAEQQHSWIKFSNSVARAQDSVFELMKILERAAEKELEADLELVRSEIEDIDLRRESDFAAQDRQERRKETREEAEEGRVEARFEAELQDQTQLREEREALKVQGIKERESRLKIECRRDHLLMSITAISFVCTIALLLFAAISGHGAALGGSGFTGIFSIAGMLRLYVFGPDKPQAPPPGEPPIGITA